MPTWLRSLSVFSVLVGVVLRIRVNDWVMPTEPIEILFGFGPQIVLLIAALVAKRRGPCVAVLIATFLSCIVGTPALRDARTFGEAGAVMIMGIVLVEALICLTILVFAIVMRPELQRDR